MNADHTAAYGEEHLSVLDRVGFFLRRRKIKKRLALSPESRILDLGCGYDASLLKALIPKIREGVGIDVAISDAARREKNLELIDGTIEDSLGRFPDDSFDAITVISVLEHLLAPDEVVAECRRLLRPGGKLVVHVPTWWGRYPLELLAFRIKVSPSSRASMDDHKRYYRKTELWLTLRAAGFLPSKMRVRRHMLGWALFAVAEK